MVPVTTSGIGATTSDYYYHAETSGGYTGDRFTLSYDGSMCSGLMLVSMSFAYHSTHTTPHATCTPTRFLLTTPHPCPSPLQCTVRRSAPSA